MLWCVAENVCRQARQEFVEIQQLFAKLGNKVPHDQYYRLFSDSNYSCNEERYVKILCCQMKVINKHKHCCT